MGTQNHAVLLLKRVSRAIDRSLSLPAPRSGDAGSTLTFLLGITTGLDHLLEHSLSDVTVEHVVNFSDALAALPSDLVPCLEFVSHSAHIHRIKVTKSIRTWF